jgi:O-acetyl-ADP-ribose deacetylase (regulator of RNase III)
MTTVAVYRGDITKIQIECIVNAANSSGLGCHTPGHPCIDNAIHRAAGRELYEECKTLNGVPTGVAKLTKGYKLPAKYIMHVTGPCADGSGEEDHEMLTKCYTACLDLAKEKQIKELAFCCISTGIFGYDKRLSAVTAINSVTKWIANNPNVMKTVLFVTFTDEDEYIYTKTL